MVEEERVKCSETPGKPEGSGEDYKAPRRGHSFQRKTKMRPEVLEGAEAPTEDTRNVCEVRVLLEKPWETARAVQIFPKGEGAGFMNYSR